MGRAARVPVVEADPDSDDGAPEEVNLSAGKDEAEKLRREERESQKRVIAAAKEKRKKASGAKEGKSKKKQRAEVDSTVAAVDELAADGEEEPQNQQRASRAVTHGLLDESIVKFLAEQEKKVVEITDDQLGETEPQNQEEKKEKKKKKRGDTSSSRVKVVVLSQAQPKAASFHSALEFKRNRLYGEGVHRSLVMLPKNVR